MARLGRRRASVAFLPIEFNRARRCSASRAFARKAQGFTRSTERRVPGTFERSCRPDRRDATRARPGRRSRPFPIVHGRCSPRDLCENTRISGGDDHGQDMRLVWDDSSCVDGSTGSESARSLSGLPRGAADCARHQRIETLDGLAAPQVADGRARVSRPTRSCLPPALPWPEGRAFATAAGWNDTVDAHSSLREGAVDEILAVDLLG